MVIFRFTRPAMPVVCWRCQLVREREVSSAEITTPALAADVANKLLADSPTEQFIAIFFDTARHCIGAHVVSIGTIDASLVHPRESFRAAIIANAKSVIFAHNHPSGRLRFSADDRQVCDRLKSAGAIIGIDVDDFIIVDGRGNYASLQES